ncbi:MAG: aminoacyl-tRNA hydrolase [Bacteroidota bacterium]
MGYLIIGLGNIGAEYVDTRHNIGFMVLDQLAALQKTSFVTDKLGMVATCEYQGCTLYLLKPTTYMNLSGRSVCHWLGHTRIHVIHSLVIVDDVALPFGKLRMKARGSAAGHNGLKNIEAFLGTQAYPRLRMGIGSNFPKGRRADYVLAPFTAEEQKALPASMAQACQMILSFCASGIGPTMERYNNLTPQ